MSKPMVLYGFLILLSLYLSISNAYYYAHNNNNHHCSCEEEEGFEDLLNLQRVSDFFISVAYFSIPIELIYFVSRSSCFPFKWVLFQFIAFIVLCGMTHLLNSWTYGPHGFGLRLAVTVFKLLTALVSFATAITLVTLIPLLLKVKVRELLLVKKMRALDREVGLMRRQTEAGKHVRMLTSEIRRSLDRHTILYTTMVELSKALGLRNCAVWMPDPGRTEMGLTHELAVRGRPGPVPMCDPVVRKVKGSGRVEVIDTESPLAAASGGGGPAELGSAAAVRMPMLRVANFKGGTPEMVRVCYAILVLVLPSERARSWTRQELELVEVVADQVAVALSHVAVLEESQLMKEKLEEQNLTLDRARREALMANRTRDAFRAEMCYGLRRPIHSVLGLSSVLRSDVNLSDEQRLILDSVVETSEVLATLTSEVTDSKFEPFSLRDMIKRAACASSALCSYRGCDFSIDIDKRLPSRVSGDEGRLFWVILHMVGNSLNATKEGGGCLMLRIYPTSASHEWNKIRANSYDGFVFVRFDVRIQFFVSSRIGCTVPLYPYGGQRFDDAIGGSMSFEACRKLVQLMHGDMWAMRDPEGGFHRCTSLLLPFKIETSTTTSSQRSESSSDDINLFKGLRVVLVDPDDTNRAVTRKMLERLGCVVSSASSGLECLGSLGPSTRVFVLDLDLPDMDGFEVGERIRELWGGREWPLIVALTSGDDDEEMRDECVRIGINGLIRKPASLLRVAAEVKRVLLLHADNM